MNAFIEFLYCPLAQQAAQARWSRGMIVSLVLILPVSLNAQSPSASAVAIARKTMTEEALVAFKAGDQQAGVLKLQAGITRGPNVPHEDLQLARLLLSVTFALKHSNDLPRSADVANLLLNKLAQPESRMSAKDAAASYMLAGELHELRNNPTLAKAAYERAVALDPILRRASERLVHLRAIEEKAQARASANAMLQQRAKR
jgi:hypothetical protein